MGFTDRERERLMRQGAVFREPTTAVFPRADTSKQTRFGAVS